MFGFFGYCEKLLDTSKFFCYFSALDMAPTYAVPAYYTLTRHHWKQVWNGPSRRPAQANTIIKYTVPKVPEGKPTRLEISKKKHFFAEKVDSTEKELSTRKTTFFNPNSVVNVRRYPLTFF